MRENDLIRCFFDGRALVPDGNHAAAQLHDRLGEGQVVHVDLDPARSGKSHRNQFAFVNAAWDNLPEHLLGMPYAATPETLRKHALIKTGFCDVGMVAVGDQRRAERVAAMIHATAQKLSGYAITEAEGPVVYCFTPLSQSVKDMGGVEFQRSKQAILEWMADLIGVSPEELAKKKRKKA